NDQPEFSNGWLYSFQKRHNFHKIKLYGESSSANMVAINLNLLIIICTINHYSLCDIYNMDETGLFYSLAPDHTFASRQIEGSKKDKKWVNKLDAQMRELNHYILLVFDNATSHVVNHDEASKNNIYKVDQLQVSVETIKNCWAYTKIGSPRNKTGMPIIFSLSIVYIENAEENISVKTNVDVEDNENKSKKKVHQQFTNDNFVQGIIEIEQVEEEEAIELFLISKEQLNILREALKIVVEMVEDNRAMIRFLHKVQAHIHEEIRKEKNKKQVQ
ncbi:10599_t:CDS:2, partial [Dentiscutata heterogama]